MGAERACQLPHSFDGVQFRTVWRKEVQPENITVCREPFLNGVGMVPAGIVHNDNHATSFATMAQKEAEKPLERFCVEFGSFYLCDQPPVMTGNSTEDGHGLACRCMEYDGVGLLRWYPHQATGAMLLKMAFIFKPEINVWIESHAVEFFYMPAAVRDQHGQ